MGRTENQSQFKWRQSRSKPSPLPMAGVASIHIGDINEPPIQSKKRDSESPERPNEVKGDVMEPPLQRKKRPVTQATTNTTQWHGDSGRASDYILLGNQGKFANNVQYLPKRAYKKGEPLKETKAANANDDAPQSKAVTTNGHAPQPMPSTPPPAPRYISPAPKVVVDTGAPRKSRPVKPTSPPAKKTKVVTMATKAPPEETKKIKENLNLTKLEAQKENDARRAFDVHLAKEEELRRRQVEKERSIAQRKKAKNTKVNEVVQTDLDVGLAESAQDSNYAMKYRAGVAPPRNKGPKRASEYQLQYKWMKGVPNSPLLAADQVVYKSNTQIGPYKTETRPKKSEYATQFKEYQPVKSAEPTHKPAKQIQRSKSLEVVSPDRLPPAGLNRVTSNVDPRMVQESLNPNHFSFPHGKYRSSNSEYDRNFRAPKDYVYEDGAWSGVPPPHVEAEPEPEADSKSWYSEVIELRKKAAEYRMRARGTHFSRSHMAQLYAQNAEMWDSFSVVSALSLETKSGQGAPEEGEPADQPPVVTEAWNDKESKASTPTARSNTWSVASESSTFVNAESEAGRLQTPQVRKRAAPYVRHHLDRTTPCSGGALLSSPPRVKVTEFKAIRGQESTSSDTQSRPSTAPPQRVSCTCDLASPDEVLSYEKAVQTSARRPASRLVFDQRGSLVEPRKISVDLDEIFAGTKPVRRNLAQSIEGGNSLPTFGMPTRDTHELLDEDASTDRPLATHFVQTPNMARLARQKFPEADVPPTIDENMAPTFGKFPGEVGLDDIPRRPIDDDALSTSIRSVASSCSMASEIFERAKKRRDIFWGPHGEVRG